MVLLLWVSLSKKKRWAKKINMFYGTRLREHVWEDVFIRGKSLIIHDYAGWMLRAPSGSRQMERNSAGCVWLVAFIPGKGYQSGRSVFQRSEYPLKGDNRGHSFRKSNATMPIKPLRFPKPGSVRLCCLSTLKREKNMGSPVVFFFFMNSLLFACFHRDSKRPTTVAFLFSLHLSAEGNSWEGLVSCFFIWPVAPLGPSGEDIWGESGAFCFERAGIEQKRSQKWKYVSCGGDGIGPIGNTCFPWEDVVFCFQTNCRGF